MLNTEKYLYEYKNLTRQLKDMELQIEEIIEKKYFVADKMLRGHKIDDVRIQTSGIADPVYDAVQKIVDVYGVRIDRLTKELNDIMVRMDDIKRSIDKAQLTNTEYEYVRLRYFQEFSVSGVANKLGYCERQIKRIKAQVLKKLALCFPD